jgi:nucleoside-diphosphate-sugar epimerase
MTTILITGADGFIAPHIIRRLHEKADSSLVTVARRPTASAPLPHVARVIVDLADPDQTLALMKHWQPSLVIHAAGQRSLSEAEEWRNNVGTSQSIMDAVGNAAPNAHLILFGSAAEYGLSADATPIAETSECRPVTAYGRAKRAMTEEALDRARRRNLNVTVLRPFNVIGKGMPQALAAGAFLAQIRQLGRRADGYRVKMGSRHHVRDFVAVDDLVSVVERVLERRISGEVINVCTGQGRTLDDLLTRMATLAGARLVFEDGQPKPEEAPTFSIGDCSKADKLLAFTPSADLDTTLREMWQDATAARSGDKR